MRKYTHEQEVEIILNVTNLLAAIRVDHDELDKLNIQRFRDPLSGPLIPPACKMCNSSDKKQHKFIHQYDPAHRHRIVPVPIYDEVYAVRKNYLEKKRKVIEKDMQHNIIISTYIGVLTKLPLLDIHDVWEMNWLYEEMLSSNCICECVRTRHKDEKDRLNEYERESLARRALDRVEPKMKQSFRKIFDAIVREEDPDEAMNRILPQMRLELQLGTVMQTIHPKGRNGTGWLSTQSYY